MRRARIESGATGGLQLGDEVLSINGNRVTTPLAAASMLREGEGIIRLSVRRQAAASGSSSGAGPSEAKHGVSGLPRLGLSHAIPQEEERDLGELSARALKGVADWFSSLGDDFSRLMNPKVGARPARSTATSHCA